MRRYRGAPTALRYGCGMRVLWAILVASIGCAGSQHVDAIRVLDGPVSAYIVTVDEHRVALVDCGMDPDAKTLLAELARRGHAADDVEAIFLTHRHADHAGGCDRFVHARRYAFSGDEPDDFTPVTDGQPIDIGSLRVTPFAVPGHTADSGAYLARGVLYLGDAAMVGKDGHVKASARRFRGMDSAPDTKNENVPPLRALVTRLQHEPVLQLAFGHSAPLSGLEPLANVK